MNTTKHVNLENIRNEFKERTEVEGYMLNLSINRAEALKDMAKLYVAHDGKGMYSVPSSNFSDTEIMLWELFINAVRFGRKLDDSIEYSTELK